MEEEQKHLITKWWNQLQPLVLKFIRETNLPGFEKEDLCQECFLQLKKALENYREESGVSFAYYYKMVLRGWRANQNRKGKNKETICGEEQFLYIQDERVNIEKDIERIDMNSQLQKVLGTLEESSRRIIIAYYFENKKLKDIALELGMSYKNVEYRKKVTLQRLKEAVSAYYYL